MPIYTYLCGSCGREVDKFRSLHERLTPLVCECGGDMSFTLSVRPKIRDLYPFVDEHMDSRPIRIESLKHYRQELSKRNLIETGRRRGTKGQWI